MIYKHNKTTGGVSILAVGYIVAEVYTSRGELPIEGATVAVTSSRNQEQNLIGFRLTNRNGKTQPIKIETPDEELSQHPSTESPFAAYDIRIDHPLYYTIIIHNAQIFPNTTSIQTAQLIPIEEKADPANLTEKFNVVPQNL